MVSSWNFDYLHMYDPDTSGKGAAYFAQYGAVFSSFSPDRVTWLENQTFAPGTQIGLYFQWTVAGNKYGEFNRSSGTPSDGQQPNRNQVAFNIGDPELLRDNGVIDGFQVDRSWFLTAADGTSYVFADNGGTVWFNIANLQVRQFILGRIVQVFNTYPVFDYVWLDNRNLYIGNHTGDFLFSQEFGAGDSQTAIDAMIDWGQWLDTELGKLGINVGGNIQGGFGDNFRRMSELMDLVFIEHALLNSSGQYESVTNFNDDVEKCLWLATEGKYVAVRGSISYDDLVAQNAGALARQNYFVAACHLVAGTRMAVKTDNSYNKAYLDPSLDDWNILGHPTSNPVRLPNGNWYREFGNGTLTINPSNNTYTRTTFNGSYNPTTRHPLVSPIVNQVRTFLDMAELQVYARSTDGAVLSYGLGNAAPGWAIDSETGVITGKLQPLPQDLYFYNMSVEVSATKGDETKTTFYDFVLEGKPGIFHDGFNAGGGALSFDDGVIGADQASSSVYRQGLPDGWSETDVPAVKYGEWYSFLPDALGNQYLFRAGSNTAWQVDVSGLTGRAYVLFVLRTGGSDASITLAMPQVGVSFEGDFYEEPGAGANKVKLKGYNIDVSAISLLDITLTNNSGTSRFGGVLVYEYLEVDPNPATPKARLASRLLLLRRLR